MSLYGMQILRKPYPKCRIGTMQADCLDFVLNIDVRKGSQICRGAARWEIDDGFFDG